MRKIFFLSITLLVIAVANHATSAQVKERVRFQRGATSSAVSGTVRGYAYHDYLFRASAGQTIHVTLNSTGSPSVFSIFKPNRDNLDEASESNDYQGELPVTGEYSVRVLMMRSAARRKGSQSNYKLKISIM